MVKSINKQVEKEKKVATKQARKPFKVTGEYEDAVPEGFDFGAYKPLKKKNFKQEYLWYLHKAAEMEFKATKYKTEAEEIKKLGSPAERMKKKQIIRLQSKMDELKKQLTEQGIDVEALLAEAVAKAEKK